MGRKQFYSGIPRLSTERLELREMRTGDADDVFAYASDPMVPKYLRWDPHPTREATKGYIADVIKGYRNGTDGPWVIVLKETGAVIGAIHIYDYNDTNRRVEIGYVLARACWNRGIMTEALEAVVAYCFSDMKINRVQAICKTANGASARVLEKAGLVFEGTLREYLFEKNALWDVRMYAILKKDWRKPAASY